MFSSEKEFGDCLWEVFSRRDEVSDDWCMSNELYDFSSERNSSVHREAELSSYGVVDFMATNYNEKEFNITLLEIKNTDIKASHIGQLSRYVCGVIDIIKSENLGFRKKVYINAIIVGTDINHNDDSTFISNIVNNIEEVDGVNVSFNVGKYEMNAVDGLSLYMWTDWTKTNKSQHGKTYSKLFSESGGAF